MSVRPFKRHKGKDQKYYFKYRDHHGNWVMRVGCLSYADTVKLQQHLSDQATLIREGALDPRIASAQTHSVRPVAEMIEEFRCYHASRAKPRSVTWTQNYLQRCVADCEFSCLRDFDAARLDKWLQQTFSSKRSHEAARKAVRHFIRWAIDFGRITFDPIAAVKSRAGSTGPVRPTRVMTADEFNAILDVAPEYRRVYYQIALYAMLRWSEIARLDWADLDIEDGTITVRENKAKAKRHDVIPMHSELRSVLLNWRTPSARLTSKVVAPQPRIATWRRDVNKAGLEYVNDRGQIDRKCLRATGITWLLEAGVPLAHVAKLARHTDPKVTIRYYAKLRMINLGDAIETLAPNKHQGGAQNRVLLSDNDHQGILEGVA